MANRLTRPILARLRLASQALLGSTFRTPLEAVQWMTAMQGQDFPGALHSVALRVPGVTRDDVRTALDTGSIVRSWPMRGTLHLTAAEDLGWIMGLTSERIITGQAGRHRQLEITPPDVEAVRDVAWKMLDDGGSASREELQRAFESVGQDTGGQRGIHLLWLLNLTGTLVQGPVVGATQHFVRTDKWILNPRKLERGEAVAELTLRYFRSHGPATLADFTWWSKLTLKDARAGLDRVKAQLIELSAEGSAGNVPQLAGGLNGPAASRTASGGGLGPAGGVNGPAASRTASGGGLGPAGGVNGPAASRTASGRRPGKPDGGRLTSYWLSKETAALLDDVVPGSRSLLLLPGFDEFLLGYADRTAALDPGHKELIVPGGNGMFKPTIVAGGRVIGTWRKAAKGNGAVVEPLPFAELTAAQNRGLGKAAAGYARFLAP